jgi:hypothetical protein
MLISSFLDYVSMISLCMAIAAHIIVALLIVI